MKNILFHNRGIKEAEPTQGRLKVFQLRSFLVLFALIISLTTLFFQDMHAIFVVSKTANGTRGNAVFGVKDEIEPLVIFDLFCFFSSMNSFLNNNKN